MTDQMTYRQKIRNEKEEIDLVQMIQYVLQKWKILLLAGVVGLLLGGAFGAMKTGKEPAQMDINDLNADQIQQYANYHQFYEDEVARQKESIYMNMDPGAVYMADKSYYVAAQESDLNRLGLAISSILQKQDVYDRIWAETGLTCSQSSLSELMSVTFAETEKNAIQLSDDRSSDGRVNISVAAPSGDRSRVAQTAASFASPGNLGLSSSKAGEAQQLASAYHSALKLAAKYHCESVAFPLLSSGNYGYPKEQAFRIAVDTITQYVMEHDLTVYLVLYDRGSLAVSRKMFASVEEYIDDHYVAQNDDDRIIDIDILMIDDLVIDEPDFKVPHPLMEEREFVMKPLKEILR